MSETRDEYLDRNEEIALFMGAIALDRYTERQLRKKGLTKLGLATPLVAQKFAIEALGLSLSYMFFGEEGAEDWMEFSNEVYDWGVVGDIPIAGAVVELFPNPIALVDKTYEAFEKVAMQGYDEIIKMTIRDPLASRRYYESWIPDFL